MIEYCYWLIFRFIFYIIYRIVKNILRKHDINLNVLNWSKNNINKPIVVIGGINNLNYKRLLNDGAKYIAISSFIWDNPKLKPELAIRKFK